MAPQSPHRKATRQRLLADPRRRVAMQEKRRGHVLDFPLVELAVEGVPQHKIGEASGRKQDAISHRLRQLGFHGHRCVYSFGQPVNSRFVRSLKERTGLSGGELATRVGVKTGRLKKVLYPGPRYEGLSPKIGRRVREERKRILAACVAIDFRRRSLFRWASARPSIVKTLLPELPRNYSLLLKVLPWLGKWLRQNPSADVTETLEQLCREARVENAQSSAKKIFVPFLKLAKELKEPLARDLERLRGAPARPHARQQVCSFAWDWLGFPWGIEADLVRAALEPRTRMVAPTRMRALILSLDLGQARAPIAGPLKEKESRPDRSAARRRGRPREVDDEQCRQMESLREEGLSWRECTKRVAPHEYAKAEAAGAASVKTLIERYRGALRQYLARKLKKAPQ